MKIDGALGKITISNDVFTTICGYAATNCFGVKGMALRSMSDGLVHLLRKESLAKGVKLQITENGRLSLQLHIIVEHGVNIPVICRSIISEVKYTVERLAGVSVSDVSIYVDGIMHSK